MRRHYKLLLLMLLLSCAVLLLTSCTGENDRRDRENLEDEISLSLSSMDEAFSIGGYFETESDLSPEDALVFLWCYVEDEEDISQKEAREAYSVIEDYLDYLRSEIHSLKRSVEGISSD